MKGKSSFLIPLLLLCSPLSSYAQQMWSGVLSSSRATDWTQIGAGVIPTNRTQCGSTIAPYGSSSSPASPSTIANAINNCAAGTYVQLGSGTFYLNGSLNISNSNVTLRGNGPTSTILNFSSASSCGESHPGAICVQGGSDIDSSGPDNVAGFTGYTQGETTLSLGTQTRGSHKPQVGDALILNRDMNGNTRAQDTWPLVFECLAGGNICTESSNGPADYGNCGSGPCWGQFQIIQVNAISSGTCTNASPCTVSFSPPLHMPNWGDSSCLSGSSSAACTRVWWSNSPTVVGVGIESLRITGSAATLGFRFAARSWAKNIMIDNDFSGGAPHYIYMNHTTLLTIRDSYIYGNGQWQDEYGADQYAASSTLFENNIWEYIRQAVVHEMGEGNVLSYNYFIDNAASTNQANEFGLSENHGIGAAYELLEGNDAAFCIDWENYFGSMQFGTVFRNRCWGYTSLDQYQNTGGLTAMNAWGISRFTNIIGNVLGAVGFHTNYQQVPGTANASTSSYGNKSVYCLGMGNDCFSSGVPDDTHAVASTMRWGNWDVVTKAVRWCGNSSSTGWSTTCGGISEVPSGLANYANPVPSSTSLPASFLYSSAPSWWTVSGQPAIPWPAIGPDVTSGNLANSGGFANKIPARVCFEGVMGGSFSDSSPKAFDANLCYGNSSSTAQPPAPPTGLAAVVQ